MLDVTKIEINWTITIHKFSNHIFPDISPPTINFINPFRLKILIFKKFAREDY